MVENPEKYIITLSVENIDTDKTTTGVITLAQLIDIDNITGSSSLDIFLSKILEINNSKQ